MTYINLFMHISSEKGVPEGAVAQIDIDVHKMLCDEIEQLREALRFYAEWGIDAPAVDAIIEKDCGDIARSALQQEETK